MGYELKPSEELQAMEQKKEEDRKKYGDIDWNPEQGLPVYKDTSVQVTKRIGREAQKKSKLVITIIFGGVVLLIILGIIFGIRRILSSDGKEISEYLSKSEAEIASGLDITFEQHDERAAKVQQYSGGTVTVREGDGLQIIYIDGKQVGVATNERGYKFFGVGVNDAQVNVDAKRTYVSTINFVVLNDLLGGHSSSYYYANKNDNTCLVLTINENSNRVVLVTYFTDFELVTRNLQFD